MAGLHMVTGSLLIVVAVPILVGWFAWRWVRYPDDRVRSVFYGLFAGYLVGVLAATMFPIPIDDPQFPNRNVIVNLFPTLDMFRRGNIANEQAIPNVLLGVPFGFGLAFVLGRRVSFLRLLGLGVLTFLSVEILQLLLVVVWPASPRTTDVSDLLLNTLGVVIGFGLFAGFASAFRAADASGGIASSPLVDYVRKVTRE